jgi:hypothetical protein
MHAVEKDGVRAELAVDTTALETRSAPRGISARGRSRSELELAIQGMFGPNNEHNMLGCGAHCTVRCAVRRAGLPAPSSQLS